MLYRSMQIAAGNAGGEGYWLGVASSPTAGNNSQYSTLAIDPSGNLYWAGRQRLAATGNHQTSILKLDADGSQVWVRNYIPASGNDYRINSITFDASNNILASGNRVMVDYGTSGTYSLVLKYEPSGNLVFARGWGAANRFATYYSSTFDSNTWYAVGESEFNTSGGNFTANISTVNSSTGNVTASRELYINSSRTSALFGIDIDSSANIYVAGTNNDGTSFNFMWVYKLNSSYTKVWERLINQASSQNTIGRGIKLDSSEQPCLVGTAASTTGEIDLFVTKLNTSGTTLWRRKLGRVGFAESTFWDRVIDLDSDNNIYVCGTSNNGSTNVAVYAKYDASGTLQWQRFVSAGSNASATFIYIGQNDSMYIGGIVSSSPNTSFLMKLPNDGSLTGTYDGLVYGVFDAVASSSGGGEITNSSATAQTVSGTNSAVAGTASTSMIGSYSATEI